MTKLKKKTVKEKITLVLWTFKKNFTLEYIVSFRQDGSFGVNGLYHRKGSRDEWPGDNWPPRKVRATLEFCDE